MKGSVGHEFLKMARANLVVHLTSQIHRCLDALDDQMIWWRPNEQSNAVGNLVLHCAGSTRYHIGRIVGGSSFVRDRDAEFLENLEIAKVELLRDLSAAIKEADEALSHFDPDRLLEMTDWVLKPVTFMEVITHQLIHYANHTGQIAFAAKMLKADAIDDIWRKTLPR